MHSKPDYFAVGALLHDMRQRFGDSEFGYRAQGFLAHVLMRIGAQIVDIRAQGHPDILARLLGDSRPIEVEIAPTIRRVHVVKGEDIEAISPQRGAAGYLAVLDHAPPLAWSLVHHEKLKRLGPGPILLVTFRAMSERQLSQECTDEFVNLVAQYETHLSTLTFHVLRERALRGESL